MFKFYFSLVTYVIALIINIYLKQTYYKRDFE